MSDTVHPSKFHAMLSSADRESVLRERIDLIASQAKIGQEVLINSIRARKLNAEADLAKLSDVGPNTTIDLRPNASFDAGAWASQVQAKKVALETISVELRIAEGTFNEYFGAPVVTGGVPEVRQG